MKKICLSIDQMRQLKELGVETKDASMVLMFFTDEGEELGWDQVEDHGKDRTYKLNARRNTSDGTND